MTSLWISNRRELSSRRDDFIVYMRIYNNHHTEPSASRWYLQSPQFLSLTSTSNHLEQSMHIPLPALLPSFPSPDASKIDQSNKIRPQLQIMLASRLKSFFSVLKTSAHIIGIDLGTTNSCVAVLENKVAKVIPNSQGSNTTPSIVAFTKNGERLVGAPAKRQSITNSDNTIFATKRLIGKRYDDPEVQKDKKNMPYKIVQGNTGEAWIQALGNKYSPAQIGAYVLMKMKEAADSYLGQNVEKAVVTVPAYFNDSQRQATKDAGKIAGLDVVRIINQPTAAALAYGVDKQENRVIAVYDLGGGTFDISILEIGKSVIEVKATNGDTACGGEDVDGIVQQYLLQQFKTLTGIDVSKDKTANQRLREAAEKAKIELSHVMKTEINLPFLAADANGPKHFVCKLTREKLEQDLSLEFLKRTIKPCENCIKDSGIPKHKIDEVILVGGMSRMPKVQEIVKNIFGKAPNKSVNPDQAVAVGAAIQGSILKGDFKDLILLDVTPLTLSTEVKGGFSFKMIPRNTPIPVTKSNIFTTVEDAQTSISVKVLQGERQMAADNKLLGEFVLTGIAPAPKGSTKIQTTFSIDANGILHVSSVDKGTGRSQSMVIQNSGRVSDAEIDRMVKDAQKFKQQDAKRQKLEITKMNIENTADQTQTQLNNFKDQLPQDVIDRIQKSIDALQELRGRQITHADVEGAEKLIEEAKAATLQIGVSLNKQAGGKKQ